MKECTCGSFAVNKDPERVVCDVCYAYKQGYKAGLEKFQDQSGGGEMNVTKPEEKYNPFNVPQTLCLKCKKMWCVCDGEDQTHINWGDV